MRGVFERRCIRNISSSPRNSSTPTPCLQLRQIQGYDCLLVHVRSPVGMVPRTRHICLATNQSQVHRRLPWFRGRSKQCIASCATDRDLTPAICSSPAVFPECVPPAWTRSKGCHRCEAAAVGMFARFPCGYNRLVTPSSWALIFVKAPFRSLRASSNMACSIWIVFTLAPTWVSVLCTAACIASFTRCPWKSTT